MRPLKTAGIVVLTLVVIAAALLAFLIARGFRASSEPSKFEASIARTIRNAAIPLRERTAKNPMPWNADVLAQGRDLFLSRCAVCHGIDGSGRTNVGAGLYPRVPDLRATKTQTLTDGEIHYIIENGVQLTGMPAWGNRHNASSDDSWKLTAFIRSFNHANALEQVRETRSAAYVGSDKCEKCHEEIYARWYKTPMANIVRDPREHPELIAPGFAHNNVGNFDVKQVAFVYGSIWKQRYFTKVGDDYFPLPVQWDVGTHQWLKYQVPATGGDWWAQYYPPDNMHRPTGPTCDGCHSVGYDIHTKQVAEWNVGCERCHGPGSVHVERPTRENIVNPAAMDSIAASDTCIQCHSQGRPRTIPIDGKYYDWPVGYQVGLRLQDFWQLDPCAFGETNFLFFPDCTAHKNRMQGNDFVQSLMYRRGITCFTCHDVHGTGNYAQLRKPADKLCLDCHGPGSPNGPHAATIAEHTHHRDGSVGSQCVACHMPQIEGEGVPGAFVHAHTFRFISPGLTERYKIPNPCTQCHTGRSTAWAKKALSRWNDVSAWRVQ